MTSSNASLSPRSRRQPGLFLKLMGAFVVILLTMTLLATWLARRATQAEFTLYTTSVGERQATLLAPSLANYYRSIGGWAGVEQLLGNSATQRQGGMMGPGMRRPGMMGPGSAMMRSGEMWAMMGLRALVVDDRGRVVADSAGDSNNMRGQRLDPAALVSGAPITVGDEQVGTLLVTTLTQPDAQSEGFLQEVNRAILWAVLGAGALALIVGGLLTWRLTRPLRTLTEAAEGIAAGDLAQQVDVRPGDEIGDLATAFNQMAARLARSEALRRQMTADVAHELRTPLTVIQGNVEALQDGVFPLTAEALAPIEAKTALLIRLVEDLRQLALVEADVLSLEQGVLDPVALVRELVAEFRPAAREKGISLSVEAAPTLPPVTADRQRLAQVLGNLLGNALRHTPAGGTVTVTVSREGAHIPGFVPPAGLPYLLFSVSDSGPGVAPADLPNLFERFYRADKGRGRGGGESGSGLGLAIARALVEAHGGTIGAANVPDSAPSGAPESGAIFWFTLPI